MNCNDRICISTVCKYLQKDNKLNKSTWKCWNIFWMTVVFIRLLFCLVSYGWHLVGFGFGEDHIIICNAIYWKYIARVCLIIVYVDLIGRAQKPIITVHVKWMRTYYLFAFSAPILLILLFQNGSQSKKIYIQFT